MKVDGDVGSVEGVVETRERCRVADGVDAAGVERERCEHGGRSEDPAVLRQGARERANGWDAGQEVAEAERPQHDESLYGQDVSPAGAIRSSRTSQPAGCRRANMTALATSAGSTSWASAGGW
jgi:hypothetical protein